MTEGSLITEVRELSSRASVIDLKGDVTAAETALADAYTRASGKFTAPSSSTSAASST